MNRLPKQLKLSDKSSVTYRLVITLITLYVVGLQIFNDNLITKMLAAASFAHMLLQSVMLIVYMQWRAEHNWENGWIDTDDLQ